jgi:hypothetical protein
MDRTVIHSDQFVIRFCRVFGIVLLLAAVFIIYIALTVQ